MQMPLVLGIDVGPALLESWIQWLSPDPQPFLVESPAAWRDCQDEGGTLTEELKDTYRLWWGVERHSTLLWVTEEQFAQLPRPTRAALVREQVRRRRGAVPTVRAWQDVLDCAELRLQADGHRFVWWRSLIGRAREQILTGVISDGRLPSRHLEVDEQVWSESRTVLPEAKRLAGTFPKGSNTNCFGSVLEAAGAASAAAYNDVEPFESWLASACRPGGSPDEAGVVLVWRSHDGAPVHAAVTIGGGWGLEKPSKDWHSPFAVATVADIMRMSRHPGERLQRHTIVR